MAPMSLFAGLVAALLYCSPCWALSTGQQHYMGAEPFEFRDAVVEDADDFTTVIVDAFSVAPAWHYVYQFSDDHPGYTWHCLRDTMKRLLAASPDNGISPRVIAVPDETSESGSRVVSISVWEFNRSSSSPVQQRFGPLGIATSYFNCSARLDTNTTRMEPYMKSMYDAETKYLGDVYDRHAYLGGLATHPKWDGHDFAATHLHWGLALAEIAGVPATLLATPAGHPLYKSTHICETTPGVNSYSGYVNLPADATEGRACDIHTFFWFFESRKDHANAPLSLWLQGGAGSPSMTAALGENGPCKVASNSKDTILDPSSWNNEVNMLYIDQPVQVGFSYDTLINGTVNEVLTPFDVTEQEPLATLDLGKTYIGSTGTGCIALYADMDNAVPALPTQRQQIQHLDGGHYGPTFSSFFESQNTNIASGDIKSAVPLHLDTLGIVTQMPFYPEFAFNNTYGIQAINKTVYEAAVAAWPQCQELGNQFDVANSAIDPFPPKYAAGFLNSREVQDDVGVPLNFIGFLDGVNTAFTNTGDFVLGRNVAILGELLDRGVKVSMMYGDRDFQCNCLGGEQVSFAIESDTRADFHKSKYTEIKTDDSYTGGMVRHFGSLSFSRVFNVGHEGYLTPAQFKNLLKGSKLTIINTVPWYQPETTYRIFQRAMFNKYVATGTTSTKARGGRPYSTIEGADKNFHIKNPVPLPPKPERYFWDMVETCTKEQKLLFQSGTAITEDFILVGYEVANGTDVYF
ncbi:putative Alpha/Beta hydrolase protein [Seiridium cardinale]|uniref:Alpha/Beta hydrolase protein n=1 Tax=Seiridium cardinale TaxID=138064 RepID=A0ABR2XXG9_9PEZI